MFRRAFLSGLSATAALLVGPAQLVPAGIAVVTRAQGRGEASVSIG